MGHCVLLIPVPVLEPYVRERWRHYEPDWVSTDPTFTHAHVTLLAPFLADPAAGDLATVAAIAADVPAFEFRLEAVEAFGNGVIHVPAEPADPFRALTARLVRAFPQCPPYGGEHGLPAALVPHVTLDHHAGGVTTAEVAAAVEDLLPASAAADRLELHHYEEGGCRVLAGWSLGPRAGQSTAAGSASNGSRSSKGFGRAKR